MNYCFSSLVKMFQRIFHGIIYVKLLNCSNSVGKNGKYFEYLCVSVLVIPCVSAFVSLDSWKVVYVCVCVSVSVHGCGWKRPCVSMCACLFTEA